MQKRFFGFLTFGFFLLNLSPALACLYDFTALVNDCANTPGYRSYAISCLFPGQPSPVRRVGCSPQIFFDQNRITTICQSSRDIEEFKICPSGPQNQSVLPQIKPEVTFNSCGSVVRVDEQSVSEYINLTGVPFSLVYSSEKVLGNRELYEVEIPITHPSFNNHASVESLNLHLSIAGRQIFESFQPSANLKYQFVWDEKDANGNNLFGSQNLNIEVSEIYPDEPVILPGYVHGEYVYLPPVIEIGSRVYSRRTLSSNIVVGSIFGQQPNLGGWRFDIHHQYDQARVLLYLGDGSAYNVGYKEKTNGEKWIVSKDRSEIFIFDTNFRHVRTINATTNVIHHSFLYDQENQLSAVVDKYGKQTTIQYHGGRVVSITSPYGQISSVETDVNGYLSSISDPAGNTHSMSYSPLGLLLSYTNPNGVSSSMVFDAKGRLLSDISSAGSGLSLSSTQGPNSKRIIETSALSRARTIDANTSANNYSRNVQFPNGYIENYNFDKSTAYTTMTTGISYNRNFSSGFDSRFGTRMPGITNIVDGNQNLNIRYSESVPLSNSNDPFSFSTFIKTWFINQRPHTITYTPSNSSEVYASPVGRTISSVLNSVGDIASMKFANLAPSQISYDTLGRVASLTQGDRLTSMTYDSAGFLETITNALGEITTFKYDPAGRILSQRLPDNRLIQFTHDANGNVTGITPPWKTKHEMTYNGFNMLDTYLPPTIEAPNGNTSYTYSNDRELLLVNRPDGQVIEFNHNATNGNLDTIDLPNGTRRFTYSYGILSSSTSEDFIDKGYSFSGTKVISDYFMNGSHLFAVNNTFNNDHKLASETLIRGAANWPLNFTYDEDALIKSAGNQTYTRNLTNGFIDQMTLGSVQRGHLSTMSLGI